MPGSIEYAPGFRTVNVVLKQGETLDDILIKFDFSLSGFTVAAQAELTDAADAVTNLDLLPSIGGSGSDEVTFGVTSVSTAAQNPAEGIWELFVVDGSSVRRAYVQGTFEIVDAGTYP